MDADKETAYDDFPYPYSHGIAIGKSTVREFHEKADKELADTIDNVVNAAFRLGWDEAKKAFASWTSVEDAMPEKHVDVLVFAKGRTDGWEPVIAIAHRYIFKYFPSSEGEEMWSDPWRHFYTDYEITHWMPFPPFPETSAEGGEEGDDDQ